MPLKNTDTRQVSVIEGPFFPSDLKKEKGCGNDPSLRTVTRCRSDFTHSEHFVFMVMVSFSFFKMQGKLSMRTLAPFIREGLLCNGVIILLRTE